MCGNEYIRGFKAREATSEAKMTRAEYVNISHLRAEEETPDWGRVRSVCDVGVVRGCEDLDAQPTRCVRNRPGP